MKTLEQIEKQLSQLESADDLALAVARATEQTNPQAQWILLKYSPSTQPFSVLFSNSARLPRAQDLVPEAFASWDAFYLDDFEQSGRAYLLFCSAPMNEAAKDILNTWQKLLQFGHRWTRTVLQTYEADTGNQMSQMLHDVDALIDLFQNPEADRTSLQERIHYQKRLNKRLLFYMRELELLPMRISIAELISAVLQKQNIDVQQMTVNYVDVRKEQTVELDVELFDRALSEILQNALVATHNDLRKIRLEISKRSDAFHLKLKEWLIVSIIDAGTGINPDFSEWVIRPYFTTWKQSGHTGFGLAIARKILEAHGGFLEIISQQGSGTTVNMFIPWFNDDAKKQL